MSNLQISYGSNDYYVSDPAIKSTFESKTEEEKQVYLNELLDSGLCALNEDDLVAADFAEEEETQDAKQTPNVSATPEFTLQKALSLIGVSLTGKQTLQPQLTLQSLIKESQAEMQALHDEQQAKMQALLDEQQAKMQADIQSEYEKFQSEYEKLLHEEK